MLRNSANPNPPRSSNAWRRKRTASKSEPKLCRRVRSANFYLSWPGNSRPLRTSASGYRLPVSSHRGRSISHAPDNSIDARSPNLQHGRADQSAAKHRALRPLVSARTRTQLPPPNCFVATIAVHERGLAGGPHGIEFGMVALAKRVGRPQLASDN